MSAPAKVSARWLELRAAVDDRSRSADLADAVVALAPEVPHVVHDLGSGAGAMLRWLAPRIPGPQRWVLHDADADILRRRSPRTVFGRDGAPVVADVSVETIAELDPRQLEGATLIVASALLDVVTVDDARAVVGLCVRLGAPALFSLSVTGHVELDPADALDDAIIDAFNAHQRRAVGGSPRLGPDAAAVIRASFAEAGWRVRSAATPWELGAEDAVLTGEWLHGWTAAAVERNPELRDELPGYLSMRIEQVRAGLLRATVHHEDVIAWPA